MDPRRKNDGNCTRQQWFDNPEQPRAWTALIIERYLNFGLKTRAKLQTGKPDPFSA